jgi:hypothetical protein
MMEPDHIHPHFCQACRKFNGQFLFRKTGRKSKIITEKFNPLSPFPSTKCPSLTCDKTGFSGHFLIQKGKINHIPGVSRSETAKSNQPYSGSSSSLLQA